MDGGDWCDWGDCGNDRACGDVGVLSTSIESMGGSIFPVGGMGRGMGRGRGYRGGSVFMDAVVELELVANAASRDDGANF